MKCPRCGGSLVYNAFMDAYVCFRCNKTYKPEELKRILGKKRA